MFSSKSFNPFPEGQSAVTPSFCPAVADLKALHQSVNQQMAQLPELSGEDLIRSSFEVMRICSAIGDRALTLSLRAPNRPDRKAAGKIREELHGCKVAPRIAKFIINASAIESYLGFLGPKAEMLAEEPISELACEVAASLLRQGQRAGPRVRGLEAFKNGMRCAELFHAWQGADPASMTEKFYRLWWNSHDPFRKKALSQGILQLLSAWLERADEEQSAYLSRIAGRRWLQYDKEESVGVFRTYCITSYSGKDDLYLRTIKAAPAFGLHMAACGAGQKTEEFFEAVADALCLVGDWLWEEWRRKRGPAGSLNDFERDTRWSADQTGGLGSRYETTARVVQRVIGHYCPCIEDAPKRYIERAKGEHHEVLFDALGGHCLE